MFANLQGFVSVLPDTTNRIYIARQASACCRKAQDLGSEYIIRADSLLLFTSSSVTDLRTTMAILETDPHYTAEDVPVIHDIYDACRVVSFHYSAWQSKRPDRCQVPRNQELNNLLENLESIVKGYCQDVGLETSRIDGQSSLFMSTISKSA